MNEERIAELQYEAGMYQSLYENAVNAHEAMVGMLREAVFQLEYMQTKTPTGTSAAVLARINHLLASVEGAGKP